MIVNLRALILAFLLSFSSTPAAMACPYDFRCGVDRPPPWDTPYPLLGFQEQEEEEPAVRKDEKDMCSEENLDQTYAVNVASGAVALIAGGVGVAPLFWIAGGLHIISGTVLAYCEITNDE